MYFRKYCIGFLVSLFVIAGMTSPIKAAPGNTSLRLNRTALTLLRGTSYTLRVKANPTGQAITWKSSNTKVAKVSKTGKISIPAKAKGTATITAQTANKSSKSVCKVTVRTKKGVLKKTGSGLPILMYHWFYDPKAGEVCTDPLIDMNIYDFDAQMKYLRDNGYYFPDWDEVRDYVDGIITLPKKSVVVTIDDGKPSFFKLAIPVLKKYNVKATVFVINSITGRAQIEAYQSPILYFRSHTFDMHRRTSYYGPSMFLNIDYATARKDLEKSAAICGVKDVFCYPFGHYNDFTKRVLKDTGFSMAVAIRNDKVRPFEDKLALPRIRMFEGYGLNYLKFVLQN